MDPRVKPEGDKAAQRALGSSPRVTPVRVWDDGSQGRVTSVRAEPTTPVLNLPVMFGLDPNIHGGGRFR